MVEDTEANKCKKKVATYTLGCKVNQYETNAMIQKFKSANYEIVDFEEYADVYVVNTCTVTNIADRKCRQVIRKAKEKNLDAKLIVTRLLCENSKRGITKNKRDRYNN